MDSRHGPQCKLCDCHQRAGIARAHRRPGLSGFDRVDRHSHRCVLGPAKCLTGFVLTADDFGSMENLGSCAKVRMSLQSRRNRRFIADKQELETIVLAPGQSSALNHNAHAYITAHRVNGDTRQFHFL